MALGRIAGRVQHAGRYSALMSEYCAAPGTVGDLILADFSRYVVAMREELRSEVSIHVRFLENEQAFRFIMRVNGQTIDRSPVSPLTGANQRRLSWP